MSVRDAWAAVRPGRGAPDPRCPAPAVDEPDALVISGIAKDERLDALTRPPADHRLEVSAGGTRSFAPGRGGARLGLGPAEYVRRASEETVVIALFEDVAGLDHVEAICRVPGLDGLAVGALAASMGHPGQPWREDVRAVVERVLHVCAGPTGCRRHGAAGPRRPPPADRARLPAHHRRHPRVGHPGDPRGGRGALEALAYEPRPPHPALSPGGGEGIGEGVGAHVALLAPLDKPVDRS